MTHAQTQTARMRLALGISNVGFWVLTTLAGVLWLGSTDAPAINNAYLIWVLFVATTIQALFDVAGGFVLMPLPSREWKSFTKRWLTGVCTHCFLLCIAGFLNYWSFLLFKAFYIGIATSVVGLFFFRRQILSLVSGPQQVRSTVVGVQCCSVASLDPAFTGGTYGVGEHATILLPEAWKTRLSASQINTVVQRRLWEIKSNLPARSFLFVLLWNLFGCGLGSHLLEITSRLPAHAMLLEACWMTLWGFVGLLTLPSLSRSTVFGADRAAAAAGCDAEGWIHLVPEITGEDGGSTPLSQRIFYPVPSTTQRLRDLKLTSTQQAFGNVARTNLFLSLGTLTFLGRCVHCNAGRPELWIFPPAD